MKTVKTINRIIKENWFTRTDISVYRKMWVCNWAWWKGWIKWTKLWSLLHWFQTKKGKQLLIDIDLISDMHDIRFYLWWWLFDFIKANYKFCLNMMQLLWWTNTPSRLLLFIILFLWVTIFWIKYFTWNKLI